MKKLHQIKSIKKQINDLYADRKYIKTDLTPDEGITIMNILEKLESQVRTAKEAGV